MSIRMNYTNMNIPTDYIDELLSSGVQGGIKANAFIRYFFDKERGKKNSVRFYTQTWGVTKSTVQRWIKDFRDEIQRFDDYWYLRNQQKNQTQYNYAQKSVGQMGHLERDKRDTTKAQDLGVYSKGVGQNKKSDGTNILIIEEEEDEEFFKEFEKLNSIYAMFSNRLGKREANIKAFKKIREKISLKDLLTAISNYFKDSSVKNRFNLTQFLNSDIIFSYYPRPIKVFDGTNWKNGIYYKDENSIKYVDGLVQEAPLDIFIQMVGAGYIQYIREVA